MIFLISVVVKFFKWIALVTLGCIVLTLTAVIFGGLIGAAKTAQSFAEIGPAFINLVSTGSESFDILQNLIEGVPFSDFLQTALRTFVKSMSGTLPFTFSVSDLMYEVAVFSVAAMLYHLFAPLLAVFKLGRKKIVLTPHIYDFVSIIYFVVTFGFGAFITVLCTRFIAIDTTVMYIILIVAAGWIDFTLTRIRSHGLFSIVSDLLYSIKGIAEQFIKEAAFLFFLVSFTGISALFAQLQGAGAIAPADAVSVCIYGIIISVMLLVICNTGRLFAGK